jgi:hypothetical protein
MAVNLTASSANSSGSPELIRSPRDREYVKIVGDSASANDTSNAYTSTLPAPVGVVGGAFTASISGRSITFTALNALGSNTVYVEVIGAL